MDGKTLTRTVAEEAEAKGWQAPEPFNVATYYTEATAVLFLLLEEAGAREVDSPTKAKRKVARKYAWALGNALRDLDCDRSEIAAARDLGPTGNSCLGPALDLGAAILAAATCFRYEIAAGGRDLKTFSRAPRMIRAMDRLIAAVGKTDRELLGYALLAGTRAVAEERCPPVARVARERPRSSASRSGAVRGEEQRRDFGLRERGGEDDDERRESEEEAVSPRTARTRTLSRTTGDDDGWEQGS